MAEQKRRQTTINNLSHLYNIPSKIKFVVSNACSPTLDSHTCKRGTFEIGHLKSYIWKDEEASNVNICISPG